MKMRYSRKLMLATLLAGVAAAVLYRGLVAGTAPDYSMEEFFDTLPGVAQNPPAAEPRLGSVAAMLSGLERRLQADGGSAGDWLLLAKSYYHLDRQPEARQAYDRAVAMGYDGDWMPLPSMGSVAKPTLDINPAYYSAAAANRASQSTNGGSSSSIRLKVSLAPELEKTLAPDTVVYLFAREVEGSGPPLAVVRRKARDLPLEISLDDSHSMIPGRNISSVERLVVGARIAISGSATRQQGDVEQLSKPLSARFEQVVDLHIDPSG